jgi:HK97 family phage portal protein
MAQRTLPLSLSGYGPDGAATRSQSLENPAVSLTDAAAWRQVFGMFGSASGVSVDVNVAMSVPAIWCSVMFLTGCMGALPLKLHKKTAAGKDLLDTTSMAKMLSGKVNDEYLTSFNWRRNTMASVMLTGRGMTYIERFKTGDARYLWPFETTKTTVSRKKGKLTYKYREGGEVKTYVPADVIDMRMLDALDGVGVFNPVEQLKDTIGLAVALRRYASRYFQNGGVPPLAMEGPAASPAAVTRGKNDIGELVKQSTANGDNVLYVPTGHKLTQIGFNPEKSQLLEAQRFIVEEVSRIYNLPPAFLHSLLNATFANVEQQDLNLVKHSLVHWVEQWEQELNAKLFGVQRGRFVEFDLNALLRGDLISRMAAYASAITNAVMAPNEARRRENLPDAPGGDRLFINSASVPIDSLPAAGAPGGEDDVAGDPAADPNLTEPAGGGDDPADPHGGDVDGA